MDDSFIECRELCLTMNDTLIEIFKHIESHHVNTRCVCKKWQRIYDRLHNIDAIRTKILNILVNICSQNSQNAKHAITGEFVRRFIAKESLYGCKSIDIAVELVMEIGSICVNFVENDRLIETIDCNLKNILKEYGRYYILENNQERENENFLSIKILNIPIGFKFTFYSYHKKYYFDVDMCKMNNVYHMYENNWYDNKSVVMDVAHIGNYCESFRTKTLRIIDDHYLARPHTMDTYSNLIYFCKTLIISMQLVERMKDGWTCSNVSVLNFFNHEQRMFIMPCCKHAQEPEKIYNVLKNGNLKLYFLQNQNAQSKLPSELQARTDDILCPFCEGAIAHGVRDSLKILD